MFAESRSSEEPGEAPCPDVPRRVPLLAWVVLVGVSFGCLPDAGWSQETPLSPRPPDATATQGADNLTSSSAGGQPLAWPPYQPGLTIESDCFINAEVALVVPHLCSLLTAPVTLQGGGPTSLVSLRNAPLDATVSPLLQIGGFRFGPGYGELALSYRLLAADGTDVLPFETQRRSRLNLQTFSLDYLRNDCPLPYDVRLSWDVGARLQVVFFDTQARSEFAFEQARNYFFGAGPHAGVGLTRMLGCGFGVYGRVDAALIVGYNTAQNFTLTTNNALTGTLTGSASQQETQLSPSFAVQTGLTWTPAWLPTSRFRTGYQFEQWYDLGHVARSHGDLGAHSLFLSVELAY